MSRTQNCTSRSALDVDPPRGRKRARPRSGLRRFTLVFNSRSCRPRQRAGRIRSASGSAKARPIARSLRALPARRLRPRPIWSRRRAAICKASPFTIPRSTALLPPLLNFKGYVALQAWRVSNWLWRQDRTDLALLLQSLSSDSLQVSIHPSASIGTVGVSRSCDRHHRRRIRRDRRRGDDPAKRHHRPQAVRFRTARRESAAACCSAPARRSSATSASATSPRSAPARSSSMTCRPDARRSACRRG